MGLFDEDCFEAERFGIEDEIFVGAEKNEIWSGISMEEFEV